MDLTRILPTGECWCGCGRETGLGSFFIQGHDKFAESAILTMKYGKRAPVAQFVLEHGYGPGGKNLREEYASWRKGQR